MGRGVRLFSLPKAPGRWNRSRESRCQPSVIYRNSKTMHGNPGSEIEGVSRIDGSRFFLFFFYFIFVFLLEFTPIDGGKIYRGRPGESHPTK